MSTPVHELEGTWEEIMAHAAELAGRRLRVTVLPVRPESAHEERQGSPDSQQTLELLAEWEQTPLTEEERAVLDGLEQHLKEQPFSLRGCLRQHQAEATMMP